MGGGVGLGDGETGGWEVKWDIIMIIIIIIIIMIIIIVRSY